MSNIQKKQTPGRRTRKTPSDQARNPEQKDSRVDFFERVWMVVADIPRGRVSTYGHIAAALGARSSSRMVGWAMNAAHSRPWIPAHRVVNRNGELSGKMHFATPTLMRELLEAEDVEFIDEHVNMNRHLWIPEIGLY